MSNFYEDLLKFSSTQKVEKTASTKGGIEAALKSLSDEEIEVLAEEIGIATKIAETLTAEEKATESARASEGQSEKDHVSSKEDTTKDGTKDEDDQIAESKSKADKTVKDEDDQEEPKKESDGVPTPPDVEDEEYEITASEILYNILKEAADEEEFEEKLAEDVYKLAGEILKIAEVSLEEYVENKVGDEEVAEKICEKAEQISKQTGTPALQIADDLIAAVANNVSQGQSEDDEE